jgi:glycosyltransferase involved in cell wall biosynthesis
VKILIITEHFWPENFRINDLSEALFLQGYEVDVLTGYPNYPEGKIYEGYKNIAWSSEKHKEINIFRVPIIPRMGGSAISLFFNYISFVISASFRLIFLKKKYDHIFVFESSPITVCLPALFNKIILRRKVPISMWVLDLWPDYFFDTLGIKKGFLLSNALDFLCKTIYKNCTYILIQSPAFKNSILRLVPHHKNIIFFPNWSESIFLRDFPIKDTQHDKKIFMFAGNIGRLQNLFEVIKAFHLLKKRKLNFSVQFELQLVGDGSALTELKELTNQLDLTTEVKFMGSYPLEEMPYLYSEVDFLLISLIPGSTFENTIPGKLQTYMASKKPIVGYIGGETHKILTSINKNFCVNPPNIEDFVDVLEYSLEADNEIIEDYTSQLFNFYEQNFSREQALKKLKSIFNSS